MWHLAGRNAAQRMLTYFINRAGRGLSKTRRAELQKAKTLLSKRTQRSKERKQSEKPPETERLEAFCYSSPRPLTDLQRSPQSEFTFHWC